MNKTAIRLLVCDDQDLIRLALIRLLEFDGRFTVVAQAANHEQLLSTLVCQARDIDVVLLDLNLKNDDALDQFAWLRDLCQRIKGLRVLVLSSHDEPETVKAVMASGARGFVTKSSGFDVLQQAIRYVDMGDKFLDPHVVNAFMNFGASPTKPAWNAELTRREREVLQLLCDGHRVSDIAQMLNLSIKTISTHKIALMKKLTVSNNVDLIKLGLLHRVA